MNNLQIFENSQFGEIRTIEEDGKILFCGKDIASALGYKDTVNALKQHCKNDGVVFCHVIDNLGREQEIKFINESNLFRLAANSKLPKAQEFESWVFDEVLPTIRKTGGYNNVPQMSTSEIVAYLANSNLEIEKRMNVVETKLDKAVNVMSQPHRATWNEKMEFYLRELQKPTGLSMPKLKAKIYNELEITANCLLSSRQKRYRTRMRKAGYTYKHCMAITKLKTIECDTKLRLIFESILRKYQARYTKQEITA